MAEPGDQDVYLTTSSVLFRRNYVFLGTVFAGAFAFEMYGFLGLASTRWH